MDASLAPVSGKLINMAGGRERRGDNENREGGGGSLNELA